MPNLYRRFVTIIGVLFVFCVALTAQPAYQPSPENLKSREWFEQARFGMFIHWGIYSELGDGEWVMQNRGITGPQYEQLAAQFDPVKYDPAQWVTLAKQAGMRYIVVTSRHHDGFSMFATKQNKYNIVDATPYGKDTLKQLADECHRQGIKLFVYYSQLDWHHPDYYPLGGTGHWDGRPAQRPVATISRLHERAVDRAVHQLRRDRRRLVRWHVGQARRRLADSTAPTR